MLRSWDVLLIGGASGVGKTSVSYRLARHYDVGITEIDDFQIILQHMTTPDQYPLVHFFPNHPDAWHRMREEEQLEFAIGFAELMATALEPVIANHLRSGPPIVLEGDFLPPSLASQPAYAGIPAAGRVKAIILYEADEEQIARNFRAREGEDQPERARSCWCYSEWLRHEATRLGVPAVPSRPWNTVFERITALLDTGD